LDELSPKGKCLYVSLIGGPFAFENIGVIDTAKNSVSAIWTFGGRASFRGLAVNNKGTLLYAAADILHSVYVIDTATGNLVTTISVPGDLNGLVLSPAIAKRAGLGPNVHIHTMRHSFASLALARGVPITTLAATMGHDTSVLMKVYGHALPSAEGTAAMALQQALAGASI